MTRLFAVLLFTALVGAQDAKIMILDRSDSGELKAAYKVYKDAQAQWEKTKTKVAGKYTLAPDGKKALDGWEKTQFSVDFRAIVPERSEYGAAGTVYNYWPYRPCIYTPSSSWTTSSGTTADAITGLTGPAGTVNSSELQISLDGIQPNLTVKER